MELDLVANQPAFYRGDGAPGSRHTIADIDSAQTFTNKTLTAPVLTNPVVSGLVGPGSAEIVTATNVILASESGTTYFLNSATEFVSTLPAPALGLCFRFIVTAAPSGASYTVVCSAAATLIKGHVLTSATAIADSGTAGEGTLTFVDGQAVAGDWAEFWSDGTNWFVQVGCAVAAAVTIS